ncbi:MAG: AMP-binding protein, partial [bacterium]|nr:AMP-binding protein [bacterium]
EEPRQLISPPGEHPLPLVDLHALAPGPRQEQLEQLMRHDEGRPFDQVRGPIFRTTLLRLVRPPERADAADRAEHVLLFCCHHIAFDGWSMGVIARELAVLYRVFAAGAEAGTDSSPLAPLPIQYADFARWQRRWLNGGEELDRQLAWWRAELDTAQPLVRLPVDHPRPEGATSRAVRRHFTLSAATSEALRSLSRRRGATLFMTLAAAFQTLLHRHTGAGAVVVGTPIANRNRRELEGLIGFFVNTQVLRTDFRGDPPFVELLERVRQAALGAYGHQDLPFEKLVEALQSDRRAEPQPLFQALFALQNAPLSPLGLPGVTLRPLYAQEGERERGALLDLTLGMVESGDILEGFLDFDATVFEPATIDALHDHLRRLLEEIAVDPDRRVGDLPIMSETERRQLIERRSEERREEAQERRQEEPEDPQAAAAAAAKRIQGKVAKRRDRLSGAARALLAKRLRGRSKKAPPAAAAIPRRPSQEPAPLSFTQEQLWFLDQLAPGKAVYNMPFPLRLPGRVEPAILAASFAEIRRRHEVLRATFRAVDGTPRMEFAPPRVDPVPLVDLAGLPASRRQKQARRLVATEGRRPFDLARGPVLRILLLRLGDDDQLIFIAHHIVFDAWSVDVLVRELFTLHSAFRSRGSAPGTVSADPGFGLEELPIQYADFAHWQRQWLRGEVMDRQLRYWKQQLAGAPPLLELPCDRPRPAVQSFRGSWLPVAIPRDLSAALTALSRRVEMTLFMTLLAAFKALLHRTTDQEDIVVGSPIAGRNRKEIEGLIGFFVNTLALRTQLDRDASFRELLAGVRLVAMDGLAHQDLPFERLVEELQPERALGSNPLFQVMFALQNAPQGNLKMPGMTASPLFAGAGTAKFDITLIIEEGASGLGGMLEYNTDLFDRSTMARFLAHFERLLQAVVADPDQRLSQLPWMTPAERHQLLVEWRDSGTVDQDPRGPSIHELFEARADAMPDAPAVVCGRTVLSYRELDARATGLAHHLRKLGVVPETVVAIAAERAPEVVVGLLGILKTGGVYLPLDPSYPEDRLAFLLDDAGARVLLVQESTVERLPGPEKHKAQVVTLDGPQAPAAAREPTESPGFPIDPDQLAYLIYTSGTTGVPKGVAVSHRQVLPVLSWFVRYFALDDDTRVLQNLSPCFDFGVFELLTTLVAGGSLCFLPAPEQGELTRSLDAVEQHNLNTVHTTPSFFRELTALAARGGRRLSGGEIVHLGGEAVDRDLVREIEGIVDPRCRLYNGYGPTETSINSTVFR